MRFGQVDRWHTLRLHPALERTDHRPWPLPRGRWRWRQSWRDLLFAHWPVAAARLRPLVPPSVAIQERDGTSWVGVVPFRMQGVMRRPLPDLPGVSAFPELNLRLYVEVEGKPGVWFVSLDAANRLAVWGARRFFHLPYFLADMDVRDDGQRIHYRSVRRNPRPNLLGNARDSKAPRVAFRAAYAPTSDAFEASAGTIEHFLTARYCLYTQTPEGAIIRANIHHAPWSLQTATAEIAENTIGHAQGVGLEGPPVLLHFSRRTDVVVWPLERVGQS